MVSVDDFTNETECEYKGRRYRVRDNGAVFRCSNNSGRKSKFDDIWTFGNKDEKGYMVIAGERIHRIVAFAFLGNPPTDGHVVDHIDTNRCNNRAENLRWVTRLENILLNPVTCKRIEVTCGSVENFLENPSLYRDRDLFYEQNYAWMRTVTKEEAKAALENLTEWSHSEKAYGNGSLGEWVYRRREKIYVLPDKEEIQKKSIEKLPPHNQKHFHDAGLSQIDDAYYDSLTPNAIQKNWKTPTLFPCCPENPGDKPINDYANNLIKGKVFSENIHGQSIVEEIASTESYILVISSMRNCVKPIQLAKIIFENNKYIHESKRTYFTYEGALKVFTLEQGLEWTGGDTFDDYCS